MNYRKTAVLQTTGESTHLNSFCYERSSIKARVGLSDKRERSCVIEFPASEKALSLATELERITSSVRATFEIDWYKKD